MFWKCFGWSGFGGRNDPDAQGQYGKTNYLLSPICMREMGKNNKYNFVIAMSDMDNIPLKISKPSFQKNQRAIKTTFIFFRNNIQKFKF